MDIFIFSPYLYISFSKDFIVLILIISYFTFIKKAKQIVVLKAHLNKNVIDWTNQNVRLSGLQKYISMGELNEIK